ncbi:MAG: hypothetical protein FD123_4408, partial [Bacteroidetes bacterium]
MRYLFSLLLIAVSAGFANAQEWEWTKTAGGPAMDKVSGIANDQSGNIFVTGYFDSTRLVSAGGTDIFIAKYDADGVLLWAKQVGGQNDDYATAISTDITGNCYITGFFYIQGAVSTFGSTTISEAGDADIFISKFNAGGNLLWVRNGGGRGDDACYSITNDVSGNCYITGFFSGTAIFGNTRVISVGYSDIFVSKYDAGGNLVWIKTGGGSYQDEAYAVTTDAAGNIFVTGFFTGNAGFGGTNLASAGYFDTDVFLLKYNPSGLLVWAKRAGGTGNDMAYGIDVAANGSIFVCGVFRGTKVFGDNVLTQVSGSNGFLARFESYGKFAWAKTTTGESLNEYHKVATDGSGNCYVAGSISGEVKFGTVPLTSTGRKDACIVKYDNKGTLMWALQGGGIEDDESMSISSDAAGNCFVAGEFSQSSTFGRLKFSGWALSDVFISRIK